MAWVFQGVRLPPRAEHGLRRADRDLQRDCAEFRGVYTGVVKGNRDNGLQQLHSNHRVEVVSTGLEMHRVFAIV